jgi:hypothetical protein
MISNSEIAAFSILYLAQLHTAVGHSQEEADVSIFRGLLDGLVEAKRFFKQPNIFQGVCNFSEKITIVKNPSTLRGIVRIQVLQMMLGRSIG